MRGKKLWVERSLRKNPHNNNNNPLNQPLQQSLKHTPQTQRKNILKNVGDGELEELFSQLISEEESKIKTIRVTGNGIRNENEDLIIKTFESACGKINGMDVRHGQGLYVKPIHKWQVYWFNLFLSTDLLFSHHNF